MVTSKVLTAARPGTLAVHLTSGQVRIAVNPNATDATVIVSTEQDDGDLADAVNDTTGDTTGDRYDVRIPEAPPMVMNTANTASVFHGTVGFVAQSVQTNVFVGGRLVDSTIDGATAQSTGEITVQVILPPNTAVGFNTASADLNVVGALSALDAHTVSGLVDAETILGPANIHTVSGPVDIGQYRGCDANINSVSGPITVSVAGDSRAGRIKADSVSGSVHVTNATATGLTVDAQTMTGARRIN